MTIFPNSEEAVVTASPLPPIINVVGNAESLLSKNYGTKIDEYPVIRMNWGINIVDSNSQGHRTDYLATFDDALISKHRTQVKIILLIDRSKSKLLLAKYSNSDVIYTCNHLKDLVNAIPSTGFKLLHMLSLFDIHVNIFGFDFKSTPAYYEEMSFNTDGPADDDKHNFLVEKQLINQMVHSKGWTFYS